jgi:hypothetical protein
MRDNKTLNQSNISDGWSQTLNITRFTLTQVFKVIPVLYCLPLTASPLNLRLDLETATDEECVKLKRTDGEGERRREIVRIA